jgi:carbonic anhydrase
MSSVVTRRTLLQAGGAGLATAAIAACGSGKSKSSSSATTMTAIPTTLLVRNGDEALQRLLAGNKRFVDDKLTGTGRDDVRRAEQAEGQTPFAIILGCSDSRVPPEVVFDEGIGDVFLIRVAGNTAASPVLVGSIEYAATTFSCPLLVVLGHENCGAVKAAVDVAKKGATLPGSLPAVVAPILPAVAKVKDQPADQLLQAATRENILATVNQLRTADPLLSELVSAGKLKVVGAEYHLTTGVVEVLS